MLQRRRNPSPLFEPAGRISIKYGKGEPKIILNSPVGKRSL